MPIVEEMYLISDLERWTYKRTRARGTEGQGASHTVFLSHPDVGMKVVEDAAKDRW